MNIKPNDLVKVKRNIYRYNKKEDYALYVAENTIGKVVKVFSVVQGKRRTKTWHVQINIVKISDRVSSVKHGCELVTVKVSNVSDDIYTLRLTSVEKLL